MKEYNWTVGQVLVGDRKVSIVQPGWYKTMRLWNSPGFGWFEIDVDTRFPLPQEVLLPEEWV